jgi:hypothetical protein
MSSDPLIFWRATISSTSPFPAGENEWGIAVLKFRICPCRIRPIFSRLKGLKLHYSKRVFRIQITCQNRLTSRA